MSAQLLALKRKLENLQIDCSQGIDKALEAFCARHQIPLCDAWGVLSEKGGYTFAEVLQFELDAFEAEVPKDCTELKPGDIYARAHAAGLSGLAFSGGGIRSATFNLGVVQALADMKLLRHFDYLSTVSGGGYTGGWLSKWIHTRNGEVEKVEDELNGAGTTTLPRKQPWPVQFLRRYSNYMTPKTGLFSADTWTLICTYCRNTGLNMTMLFAWLALVFLVPRLVLDIVPMSEAVARDQRHVWAGAAGVLFLWVVANIAFSISCNGKLPSRGWASQSQGVVLRRVCLPLMAAGFSGAIAVWCYRAYLAKFWNDLPFVDWYLGYLLLAGPGVLYFTAWVTGWALAQWRNARSQDQPSAARADNQHSTFKQGLGHFASAVIALTIGTALLLKSAALLVAADGVHVNSVRLATFGMPLMLCLFGATITLMIGLVGRLYQDESREWWARQGAWTVIFTVLWSSIFASTFYLPPLLDWAWTEWVKSTAIGTVLTALATAVGLKSGSGPATGKPGANYKGELIAQCAPYAFMLLTFAVITTVLQALVAPPAPPAPKPARPATEKPRPESFGSYVARYEKGSLVLAARSLGAEPVPAPAPPVQSPPVPPPPAPAPLATPAPMAAAPPPASTALGTAITWLLVSALVLGWRVDVNKFSLYMMYRLRLVRAYFGASSADRSPHPFTGFDPQDDPPLAKLLRKQRSPDDDKGPLQRPFHLINAAVNMVAGEELAWQTRKAANFCFSPSQCGFELPEMCDGAARTGSPRGAYRPTAEYAAESLGARETDAGVRLGMAVAVSGAAASPNMGYHSSPPLSFLMTLFNLRLGRWSPNPAREGSWRHASPQIGIFTILYELFGLTDTTSDFLYLSDGGHFENLGLYELVRRRCRLVVVVDASCDKDHQFGDLGNAIRKCQTDFNVPIELNASRIQPLSASSEQGVCYVTGKILYSRADGGAHEGVLLYIKPAMVGGENADILNYSKMHAEFPHESTADQWFDEDQFESYRMLGCSAANSALKNISKDLLKAFDGKGATPAFRKQSIERICYLLSQA